MHMIIYSQVENDRVLNTCFRPSHPVLVCLLNNVISAQRENIDAAVGSPCSPVRFSPTPVAHLAPVLPSLVASAVHLHTLCPSHTLLSPLCKHQLTCTRCLSPVFARLTS